MRKKNGFLVVFTLIALLLSVEVQAVLIPPEFKVTSIIPPKTGSNLKELVDALLSSTSNMTDTDGDNLPDAVEIVIGTDFNNSDSDFDRLTDYYEVMNNSLPWHPDSNSDGLPDYFEVTSAFGLDVDGDGVLNMWDFDNDGDGVNDGVDLSPFSKSTANDQFHFDIATGGNPTYATFQLRPANPEHLKLFDQFWDWPNDDQEDPMKDLDASKEDIQVVPILNITANILPDPSEVIDYGIAVTSNSIYLPLFPVWEYGNIVAFGGKMFYPQSISPEISIDAELVWRVLGNSDEKIAAFQTVSGKYVTVSEAGNVFANSSEIDALETLMLTELGENRIALRSINGLYFTVGEDATVTASSTELGDKEIFELITGAGNSVKLRAWNGLLVSVTGDGLLVAIGDPVSSKFELIDLGVWPNLVPLATYKEDFMLTGFTVEENYGSEVGLVYGSDLNQTVAANLLLAYDFLRNSTTNVSDIPTILSEQNLAAFCDNASFTHKDEAFLAMTNLMIPSGLDTLPENQNVPLVIAFEDNLVSVELSEILSGSYVMGNSCIVDMSNFPVTTTKALKTNWHNTTTNMALELEEISTHIQSLGLSENVALNLVSFTSIWNIGEQTVTKIDGLNTEFEVPEIEFLSGTLWNISKNGIESASVFHDIIEDVSDIWKSYQSIKLIKNLKNAGWSLSVKGSQSWWKVLKSTFRQISKVKTGIQTSKIWNGLGKTLEFAGYVMTAIDVGITFYSLFSIINAVESPMALNSALLELFIEFTYNVILFNIGVIPVIGWLISLGLVLSDVFGGWTNDLFEWIVSVMSRVKSSVEPKVMFADEPSITIDDKDSNGLDVGDRISYTHSVIGRIEGFDWSLVSHSGIYPYITLNGPPGSYSNVGQYYSTEWVFQARDLGMTGNDVHLWLPIPPKSSWIRSSSSSTLYKWDAQQYEVGGWIEPGIGMPNFPVTINMDAVYTLDYKWEHFVFLVFYGFWCEHLDYNKGIQSLGTQTIFFDVMPASLDDFISWRGITPLDRDGDGLPDNQETFSSAWKYDTDADGINDKFELDIGTNPILFDTDFDGLLDYFELIYDVDPTDADTDGDGLTDYLEETGWLIAFNYTGNSSLPFTMHVTSDPKIKDTDSDGIDDLTEYWSILNPRSFDTDADGIKDIPKQGPYANYELEAKLDFSDPYDPWMWLDDLDVFSNGTVLVLDRRSGQISSCSLEEMTINPWNYDTTKVSSPTRITIDEENQYIHLADSGSIKTFDFNGLWIKTWGEGGVILALEFDDDGYSYILRGDSSYPSSGWIDKYDFNGTLMSTWNSYGLDNATFRMVKDIAVDSKNGYLYLSDARRPWEGGHRIARFDLEGNWQITRMWGANDNPTLLKVDKEGFLYVIDSTHSVFKLDSNGMSITSWFYNATGEWDDAFDVDQEGNVYVGSVAAPDYTFYSIQKFSPQNLHPLVDDTVPDRDGDGLKNDEETSGWNVIFTNETDTFSISVTSDQMLNDTDTDGLTDYQENNLGTNPRDPDTDDDGLNDYVEWKGFPSQTNPTHWDTDGDGLADGVETTYGSNPLKGDTDGDGLSDFIEFYLNSDSNNPDTDCDGLDDFTEVVFNSSPNSPDSDGDLMFDGREYTEGTNPQNSDSDNDGIFDGNEVFLGTSPLNKDTDGDNVTDGIEVLLWMNPLSNDTDQDGLLDSTELERGTNPFNEDSDGDGVLDSEDEDSYSSHVEEIILAFDSSKQTSEFADNLAQYTNVTTVTVDDLLLNYKDKPYIVLVGDPEGNGTVGQLVASLLADCGDVLTGMIESDVNRIAVRHGVWNETQTVVLLSKPFPNDHYRVLDILKGKIVTIQPDSATVEFIQSTLVEAPDGGSLNHTALSYTFFKIDEIDTVKQTDSTISAVLDEAANATVQISRYNNSSTPFSLTHASGLATNERAVGKYLEINVSENMQNQTSDILSEAYIELYYRLSDLDANGDGDTTDIEDLREESLKLYFFNETSQTWTKATQDLDWVISIGVNTTNVELYGESYEGYVWAYLTHFSLYGLAAMSNNNPPDVSNAYPSIQYLWPPNHQFVDVTIEGVSDPDNDTITITILNITSNEPTNSHEPDSYGIGTSTASLRAERLGSGDGRVYTITFLASDGNGGETTGIVNVYVQHNYNEKNYENKQTDNDDNQTSNYNEQPPVIEENKTPEVNDAPPSDNTKTKKDKQVAKTKKQK